MRNRTIMIVALAAAVALLAAPGCVSKKMYRQNVEATDARVGSVETAVEANERRISDLRTETDSKLAEVATKAGRAEETGKAAMTRADTAAKAAEQAAKGKLLWSVTLSDDRVKFSFDQAMIPAEATTALDDLVGKIKSYGKAVYLEIEGHTDDTGSTEYNYSLGEKRAMAVRNYLSESGGIPLHAMNTISYGESRPVTDNNSSEGRSKNRRVVVKVLE